MYFIFIILPKKQNENKIKYNITKQDRIKTKQNKKELNQKKRTTTKVKPRCNITTQLNIEIRKNVISFFFIYIFFSTQVISIGIQCI